MNHPFCFVKRGNLRWFFGYSTLHNKFIAYSDTEGTTNSCRLMNTIEELRKLIRWYLDHEWEMDQKRWTDNIEKYGKSSLS